MADEVDMIVAAWAEQRPDLDLSPIQLLSRISRIAQLLDERRARLSPSTVSPRTNSTCWRRCAGPALPSSRPRPAARGHACHLGHHDQ